MIPAALAISKSNSAIFNSKAVEYSTCIVEKKNDFPKLAKFDFTTKCSHV